MKSQSYKGQKKFTPAKKQENIGWDNRQHGIELKFAAIKKKGLEVDKLVVYNKRKGGSAYKIIEITKVGFLRLEGAVALMDPREWDVVEK